ncbi:hypothetical protein JXL21_12930 [Candidatus Bathyarchaeota archaeon]|nr:hypothetical protein [Candidatus Bathyarchaeota archaeon]
MKVLWLSANKFGYELLDAALKVSEVEVVGVVTLSKQAKTRMYDGVPSKLWHRRGVPVHEIERIEKETGLIRTLAPDLIVMAGWRQILPRELLEIPRGGVIGFHPTLLPKGRGPAPVINSIMAGYRESGLTMYYVDESLDGGDVIAQSGFTIEDADYSSDVYRKCIEAGKELLRDYLPLLAEGRAPRVPQDDSEATVFPKRALRDNRIDLENDSPEMIMRKIRACSEPYLGAYIEVDGRKLVIWRAELRGRLRP